MTPERIREAAERIKAGETIPQIADSWNKSRQMLYQHFTKSDIKRLRQEGAEARKRRSDEGSRPALSVVK
jgi:hypothetical protein